MHEAVTPPGQALFQLATGQFVARALGVAAQLGIADVLAAGPRTPEELATATDTHAPSLARVLRLLASAGVFEDRPDGRFALTPMGEALRADAPQSVRAIILLFCGTGILDAWRDLEAAVRTGSPAFQRTASSEEGPYASMAARPDATARFDDAMGTAAAWAAPAVAAAIDFSRCRRIVDVGGGNGALLTGLLQRYPQAHGVIFDQAHAVARAESRVASAGLTDRCAVVAGSFFDGVPPGGDAYVLRHVLMDWDDERAATILGHCRAAMAPDGQVMILERVYPASMHPSASCRQAASHDVNMLVCTGGRLRTEEAFRRLLAASGFRLSRVVPTTADVSVILGEPDDRR